MSTHRAAGPARQRAEGQPRQVQAGASCARPASTRSRRRISPWGLRVDGKPALQKTDVFLRGDVEVQDEGSQLLAAAGLAQARRDGGRLLCRRRRQDAGAGRRDAQSTGRLYAFDVNGHRLDALKPRLARSGLSNVHPAQISARARRPRQAAGGQDRPRAGRRAVFRPGHAAPQPRPEVALVGRGHRRAAASCRPRSSSQCLSAAEAGRAPGLCHLQPAAPRERARSPRPSTAAHGRTSSCWTPASC